MREAVTISIPREFKDKLDEYAKENFTDRSNIVREALSQYFSANEFRKIREQMIPQAENLGIFNDEDIFKEIS
ncbi:MAG: ribbon-helix-helix domain-containing protein [Cyanobacteria bacterium]|nr:ribbon-helix-helix domain-containing protein [Cyanobacteriota bacterium]